MEFDLIYPERKEDAFDAECVIAAVFFRCRGTTVIWRG